VDDERIVNSMLCDVLATAGYMVASAASGAEGLHLMPTFNPSVVVLDLGMPGMSGMEVLQQLRRDYPCIPVVILSGNQDAEVKRRALEAGAFDYLTKPFSLTLMRAVVRTAIASGSRG
jgi:DNA-binding response OmpR family regulator